jgi:hypothetical protein
MTEPEQKSEEERPLLVGLRRIGFVLSVPLIGAALLWWLPSSQAQTIVVSLLVIVLGLAGWWYWRED